MIDGAKRACDAKQTVAAAHLCPRSLEERYRKADRFLLGTSGQTRSAKTV
jgi:hypothetical protein